MTLILAVVLLLQALPFAFLSLAFRPLPNGAELGGVRFTEWPAPDQTHPEYA